MDQDYQNQEYDQNFYDQQQNFYGENQQDDDYYIQSEQLCQNQYGQVYQILPQSALFQKLKQLAIQTKEMIGLQMGWCIILLSQFKWNFQNITNLYFQSPQKYKQKIGYVPKNLKYLPTDVKTNKVGVCNVCCMQSTLLRNICGHQFCLSCWIQYISLNINSGHLFLKCMDCTAPLLYETVIQILKVKSKFEQQSQNCLSSKLINIYQKKLCQLFTTINNSYQCCLGANCTNCIRCNNFTLTTVRCNCGKIFCFKCKSDDHTPCTCEEKKIWTQMVLKQQADAKWISVHTKLCPWCKKAVQRSAGCNFMACLCGKSFCYMCSKPWQPDHKDHFKCHIYTKKDSENQNKQKQILEKMNFYAEKYLNNQGITGHLIKEQTFEKRKFLFNILDIDLTETQFIDQAYKFAIECCNCLKWIYAFSYFTVFPSEQRKQKFEQTQGQFQKCKQYLLKILGFDLKQYFKNIQTSITKGIPINKEVQVEKFKKLKVSIVNDYTSTKCFKEKFVLAIQNMDSLFGNGQSFNKIEKRKSLQNPKLSKTKSKKVKK